MNTTVKFLVILFALAMNVTNVRADGDPKPVVVKNTRTVPTVGGNAGPKRGRTTVEILNIDILLDQGRLFPGEESRQIHPHRAKQF